MSRTLRTRLHAITAAAVIAVALVATAAPAAAVTGFGDVEPTDYYADAVAWMVDEQLTTGVEPGCFGPGEPVTRGQIATFLFRLDEALGNDPEATTHPFDDVVAHYQQDAVGWLHDRGITTGTSTNTFSPGHAVTRGDFATLLWRYAGQPVGGSHSFTDIDMSYQDDAVAWMASSGITTGTTSTTFEPHAAMTRAEAATFLFRFVDPAVVPEIDETASCDRDLRAALVFGGLTPAEATCAAQFLTDFSVEYLTRVVLDIEEASFELILAVATVNDEGCIPEHRFGELSRLYL